MHHRAARESGLVDDRRRLTEMGRQLFDRWLPLLPPKLIRKVRTTGETNFRFGRTGSPTGESTAVATLLRRGDAHDRVVLARCLVSGIVPDGLGGETALASGRQ